jgi:methylase of polypeptide subunit release factors
MLEPAAVLALEVGAGQAAGVAQLVERAGFSNLARHRDLAGIERVVSAILAPASPHRP